MTIEGKPNQPWNQIFICDSPTFHEDLVKAGEDSRDLQKKIMHSRRRSKSDKCNSDYQFGGSATGINNQRRQVMLSRMGIR